MWLKLTKDRFIKQGGEVVTLPKGTIHEFDAKRAEQYLNAKIAVKVKKPKKDSEDDD